MRLGPKEAWNIIFYSRKLTLRSSVAKTRNLHFPLNFGGGCGSSLAPVLEATTLLQRTKYQTPSLVRWILQTFTKPFTPIIAMHSSAVFNMCSLNLLSTATVLFAIGQSLVHAFPAGPAPNPTELKNLITRDVPCDDISKYTTDVSEHDFISSRKFLHIIDYFAIFFYSTTIW